MTILSPIQITSSTMLRSPSTVEYDWMEAGSEGRSVGAPSSMQNMRSCREGSEEVATWSCSQLMGIDEIAEHRASWRLSSTEMADTVESWLAGQSWLGLEMSSGRCSRGGDRAPDGWHERASLVRFLAPGMYTIRNRYLRVFSFRFLSRGFGMSSRQRSPKIFSSGLWSTATMRSLHPRTKCRALSRASTTARASPSMGAYLDSAA